MNTAAPEASVRNDTSGKFEVVASGNGRFAARGPLTFATARQAQEHGMKKVDVFVKGPAIPRRRPRA